MSKLQTLIKEKQIRFKQNGVKEVFKKEDGAIDLASIMVGIIVIGLIGGVIAATVFAVIPWSQDNAAKQQLDSIVQAENAYFGLSAANPSPLPAGTPANSFGKSADLKTAELLASGPRYCVTTPDDKKSYTGYSQSSSGTIFTVTDKKSKPEILVVPSGTAPVDALPTDCQFITVGMTTPATSPTPTPTATTPVPYVDPTPTKIIMTYQCDVTTTLAPPLTRGSSTGTFTWNDGTTSTVTNTASTKTLTGGQKYTFIFDGTANFVSSTYDANVRNGANCIRSVDHWGSSTGTPFADGAFSGAINLTSVPANIPSTVQSMSNMFKGATSLNDPNMKNWNVRNVTNMNYMFSGATAFNQDLSGWNTGMVTDMSYMFNGATSMNGSLNSWNTAKVVNMDHMFFGASSFNQPLDKWVTTNVTNMLLMFYGAPYTQDITSWDMNKVTKMAFMVSNPDSPQLARTTHPNMFRLTYQCDTTTTLSAPLTRGSSTGTSTWNDGTTNTSTTTVKTLTGGQKYTFIFEGSIMFMDSTYDANVRNGANCIRSVDHWGSATGTPFADSAFSGATNLTSVPTSIPSTVQSMNSMFKGATSLNDPNMKNWNVSNVTNMVSMFNGAISFNQDLSWNTGLVTDMSYMFNGASSMNGSLNSWNTSQVTNMDRMFFGASSFNQPLNSWNTSNVTNMLLMFYGTPYSQSLTSWDMNKVTKMAFMVNNPDSNLLPRTTHPYMFRLTYQCDTTTTLSAPLTRGSSTGTSTWNDGTTNTSTTTVKTLTGGQKYTFIFEGNIMFIDSTYDTNVRNGAKCIRSVDSWGSATSSPYADGAFSGATNLTSVPVSIPSTVTSMNSMFKGAVSFNDANIKSWNVSKVTNMGYMFSGATAFNQDLKSSWNTAAVTNGTFFAPASFPDAYMPANTSK